MSERVAKIATGLAAFLAVVSLILVLQGNLFFGGFVLTLVAFAVYLRELNLE